MSKLNRIIITALLIISLLSGTLSASALSVEQEQKLCDTGEYLKNNITPQVGSIGGEWVVIGLSRNGIFSDAQKQAYCEAVKAYVASKGTNRLHSRKSSDNSRVILALSAVGKDPRSIAGYDLTEPLADFDYVKKQGINGVIWALIALDSCNYYLQNDFRDQMLGELLSVQHSDGSWGLDENADPDVTGMALQALAPYRKYDTNIQKAVENALLMDPFFNVRSSQPRELRAAYCCAVYNSGYCPKYRSYRQHDALLRPERVRAHIKRRIQSNGNRAGLLRACGSPPL